MMNDPVRNDRLKTCIFSIPFQPHLNRLKPPRKDKLPNIFSYTQFHLSCLLSHLIYFCFLQSESDSSASEGCKHERLTIGSSETNEC